MVSKKVNAKKNDVLVRLKTTHDVDELSEILSNLSSKEISLILNYIPDLLEHPSWIIKTDTLEIIASACLKQFKKKVLSVLEKEKYYITRKIALGTFHELAGKKAIPILQKYTKDRYRIVRLCAYCRLYLTLRKKCILEQITEIVLKEDCGIWDRYYVYNFMTNCFDVERKPEILLLIKEMLKQLDPSTGLAKDIRSFLKRISKNKVFVRKK